MVDPQVISQIIGLPVLQISASPFNEVVGAPSLDDLQESFHVVPQGEERATTIRIGALSPRHRLLAKIFQHNLWPTARRNDLILKRAQFLYAICLRLPFCMCKHILDVMLEARDENNTGLPFGCLITQIILQAGIDVSGEPKMKIQDPISKQTLMKSNVQLRREDQDETPQPPPIHVEMPDIASSSQTAPPPPQHEAGYAQILAALESLHWGMSSMQQGIHSMQQEIHSINLRVEQCQLDVQECLQHHHPSSNDDEDRPPMAEGD
jgi:hypothetical protein